MTRQQPVFYFSFAVLAALVIVSAVGTPRFLAFGPGLIALVFSGLFVFRHGGRLQWPVEALKLILPVPVLCGASALWALDAGEVLVRTGKLTGVILSGILLLALVRALPVEKVKAWLWLLPAAVMAAAFLTSIDLAFDAPLYRLLRGMDGTGQVKDAVYNRGAVAVILCLFPAASMLRHRVGDRRALGLLALFVLPMLLLIESQSAQLALVVGAVFAALFPYGRGWSWYALGAAIAVYILAMPFVSIWAFGHLASDISALPFFKNGYAGPRMEIWDYVSRYMLERPFFGYGLEACRVITDFDSAQIYQEGTSILHPHNLALQLWLEFGLAGALSGTAFCLYLLHLLKTRLSAAQARIALPTMIAALSVASTGYGMWQGWWVGLLFLAAALCILAVRQVGQAAEAAHTPGAEKVALAA